LLKKVKTQCKNKLNQLEIEKSDKESRILQKLYHKSLRDLSRVYYLKKDNEKELKYEGAAANAYRVVVAHYKTEDMG